MLIIFGVMMFLRLLEWILQPRRTSLLIESNIDPSATVIDLSSPQQKAIVSSGLPSYEEACGAPPPYEDIELNDTTVTID